VKDKTGILLVLICSIGFIVRALFSVWLGSELRFPDEIRFWAEINNLLENGSFVVMGKYAHDMPMTALVAAGVIKITGCGVIGVRIFFSFVSACTIFLIANIAGLFSEKDSAKILAAIIAAFYPFFIFYSALILSETLFLFAITSYFYFLFCSHKNAHIFAGGMSGVCHLIRPTLLYFFPVVWCWQLFVQRVRLKYVFLSILCLALLIVPWGVRNATVLGQFVLGTSGTGQVLWEGNNPSNYSGGTSGDFQDEKAYLKNMPSGLNELERDQWKKQNALRYIKENPKRFAEMCWKKFIRFWHLWPNHSIYSGTLYKWLSLLSFGPVLLFSVIAFWVLRAHRAKLVLIALFVGYYTAIHIITIGSIRYRLPLEPLLISLSAASFMEIFSIKQRDISTNQNRRR